MDICRFDESLNIAIHRFGSLIKMYLAMVLVSFICSLLVMVPFVGVFFGLFMNIIITVWFVLCIDKIAVHDAPLSLEDIVYSFNQSLDNLGGYLQAVLVPFIKILGILVVLILGLFGVVTYSILSFNNWLSLIILFTYLVLFLFLLYVIECLSIECYARIIAIKYGDYKFNCYNSYKTKYRYKAFWALIPLFGNVAIIISLAKDAKNYYIQENDESN